MRTRGKAEIQSPSNKLFNPIVHSGPNTIDKSQADKAVKVQATSKVQVRHRKQTD